MEKEVKKRMEKREGIIKDKADMDLFDKLYDKAITSGGLEEEDPDIFVPVDDDDYFWQSLKTKQLVSTEDMGALGKKGEKFYILNFINSFLLFVDE